MPVHDPTTPKFAPENTVLSRIQRVTSAVIFRRTRGNSKFWEEREDLWNEACSRVCAGLRDNGFPDGLLNADPSQISWRRYLTKSTSENSDELSLLGAFAKQTACNLVKDRARHYNADKRTPPARLSNRVELAPSSGVDFLARHENATVAIQVVAAVRTLCECESDGTALAVLEAMQRGLTDKQISAHIGKSTSTVHNAHRRIDKAFVIAGIQHLEDTRALHRGFEGLRITPDECGRFLSEVRGVSSDEQFPVFIEYTLVGMAVAIRKKLRNTTSDDDCLRFVSSVGNAVAHILNEYGIASPVLRLIRELRLMVSTEDKPILQVRNDDLIAIVQGQLDRHKGKPSSDHEAPKVEVPYDA